MRSWTAPRLFIFFLSLGLPSLSFGQAEFSIDLGIGNYGLGPAYDPTTQAYIQYFQAEGKTYYKGLFKRDNHFLSYVLALEKDNIRRINLQAGMMISHPNVELFVGTALGFLNEERTLLKPGFVGTLKFGSPNILYIIVEGGMIPGDSRELLRDTVLDYSTTNALVGLEAYLNQNRVLIGGFYSYNAYSRLRALFPYTDEQNGFEVYTEFFKKRAFYSIKLFGGRNTLKKSFDSNFTASPERTIAIPYLKAGTLISFFTKSTKFYIGAEVHIASEQTGTIVLTNFPPTSFTLRTGFAWYGK